MAEEETRTSKVLKTVEILIPTADFSNIRVTNGYEETITWKTKEERIKKEDNILNLLMENLHRDVSKVLEVTGRAPKSTVTEVKNTPRASADEHGLGLHDLGPGEDIN